jgi:hypothetical protein
LCEVAREYGYWLGSPEDNAAVGISLQHEVSRVSPAGMCALGDNSEIILGVGCYSAVDSFACRIRTVLLSNNRHAQVLRISMGCPVDDRKFQPSRKSMPTYRVR